MSATVILPEASALGRAAAELGRAAGDNRALINAVNKAHLFLAKGSAEITHTGFDGWLVASATRAIVHRVNSFGQCSCEAGAAQKPCWHAQAIALLEQAGLYRRDTMSRTVSFTYRASDGSVTRGRAVPIEGGLSFPEEHRAADGTVTPIRTTWMRDGDEAYRVRSEMQRDGTWRTMLDMRMERIGPSAEPAP